MVDHPDMGIIALTFRCVKAHTCSVDMCAGTSPTRGIINHSPLYSRIKLGFLIHERERNLQKPNIEMTCHLVSRIDTGHQHVQIVVQLMVQLTADVCRVLFQFWKTCMGEKCAYIPFIAHRNHRHGMPNSPYVGVTIRIGYRCHNRGILTKLLRYKHPCTEKRLGHSILNKALYTVINCAKPEAMVI